MRKISQVSNHSQMKLPSGRSIMNNKGLQSANKEHFSL